MTNHRSTTRQTHGTTRMASHQPSVVSPSWGADSGRVISYNHARPRQEQRPNYLRRRIMAGTIAVGSILGGLGYVVENGQDERTKYDEHSEYVVYKVQPGDTPYSIADRTKGKTADPRELAHQIQEYYVLEDGTPLMAGEEILVPADEVATDEAGSEFLENKLVVDKWYAPGTLPSIEENLQKDTPTSVG